MEFFPILPMPEPDMLDFPILRSVNSINVFFAMIKPLFTEWKMVRTD